MSPLKIKSHKQLMWEKLKLKRSVKGSPQIKGHNYIPSNEICVEKRLECDILK